MTVVASTAPSTLVAPSRGTGIPIIPDVAMIEDEEEQRASNEIIEGPSSVVEYIRRRRRLGEKALL